MVAKRFALRVQTQKYDINYKEADMKLIQKNIGLIRDHFETRPY